jgi:hypothetical protein
LICILTWLLFVGLALNCSRFVEEKQNPQPFYLAGRLSPQVERASPGDLKQKLPREWSATALRVSTLVGVISACHH